MHSSNDKESSAQEYILFLPLSNERQDRYTHQEQLDWQELASKFKLQLLRERRSQAIVAATPDAIKRLQQAFPEVQITSVKKYNKLESVV